MKWREEGGDLLCGTVVTGGVVSWRGMGSFEANATVNYGSKNAKHMRPKRFRPLRPPKCPTCGHRPQLSSNAKETEQHRVIREAKAHVEKWLRAQAIKK